MIQASRRSFIAGAVALVAAPAIVRVASLMQVNAALQPQNTYLTINEITREAVKLFTNSNELLLSLDDYSEHVLNPMIGRLADQVANDIMRRREDINFYSGTQWRVERYPGPAIKFRYMKERRTLEPVVLAPLALAAAVVAVAPAVLEKPVTRRFWSR